MSIPCYFANNWKECVNKADFSYAQVGFGLHKDGSARLSSCSMPALCVIDDAVLCSPGEKALDILAAQCAHGCCLDFERPCQTAHIAIITGLRKRVSGFFALPARFINYAPKGIPIVSCPRPCNSWSSFVQNIQRQYPKGWMLELTPWRHVSPCRMKQSHGRLSDAICEYRCENGTTQYYDTRETLQEKITLAGQHSCLAAIGLYQEWQALK